MRSILATAVDLDAATVEVRRSVAEVKGQQVVKAPKSAAGRRSVALPLWAALIDQHATADRDRAIADALDELLTRSSGHAAGTTTGRGSGA